MSERISNSIVAKVYEPSARELLIYLYTGRTQEGLFISTHPKYSSIFLTKKKMKNPERPPRFCSLLRSRLSGLKLVEVKQKENERILNLIFTGTEVEYTLVVELTGKSSNVILTDGKGTVIDSLRHFKGEGIEREVYPGAEFVELPLPKEGARGGFEFTKKDNESYLEAAERTYFALIKKDEKEFEASEIRRALRTEIKKRKRKIQNLEADRTNAVRLQGGRKKGELIIANFNSVEKGAEKVALNDYTEEGVKKVVVRLDPKLGAKDNAERYFKRAKKGETTLKMLKERLPAAVEELHTVEKYLKSFDEAGEKEKEELIEKLYKEKLLKRKISKKEEKKEKALPYRAFLSSDGFSLLCGKSSKSNDTLLREKAASGDMWLHAKDVSGSHVIIKASGRVISKKAIIEAARVAAFYSRAKEQSKVEVIVTDVKFVRKVKGAASGSVNVSEFDTVLVEPTLGTLRKR
ncbi:MAG: NFACT family protein [Deltaproteobacteria bacterium]|nr:NFACT family protein [Deltaproteobacteria bacterium]